MPKESQNFSHEIALEAEEEFNKLNEDKWQQIKIWIVSGKSANNETVHWTLEKLKAEIANVYNIEITTTALWKNLKKLGLTLKKPRPIHNKADKEAQEAFKKNF